MANLFEQFYSIENLYNSWIKVKNSIMNRELAYVYEVELFEKFLYPNLYAISKLLKRSEYEFENVDIIEKPKANGTFRPIVVTCLKDQLVAQALINVIRDFFISYKKFSFGYNLADVSSPFSYNNWRTEYNNFSREVRERTQDYKYVYVTDIENFFPSINIDKLENILFDRIHDKNIRCFISKLLKGLTVKSSSDSYFSGLPLNVVHSPYFANIYLNHFLDSKLSREKDLCYFRYVDDIRIFAHSEVHRDEIVSRVKNYLSDGDLKLNSEKTFSLKSEDMETYSYLIKTMSVVAQRIIDCRHEDKDVREAILKDLIQLNSFGSRSEYAQGQLLDEKINNFIEKKASDSFRKFSTYRLLKINNYKDKQDFQEILGENSWTEQYSVLLNLCMNHIVEYPFIIEILIDNLNNEKINDKNNTYVKIVTLSNLAAVSKKEISPKYYSQVRDLIKRSLIKNSEIVNRYVFANISDDLFNDLLSDIIKYIKDNEFIEKCYPMYCLLKYGKYEKLTQILQQTHDSALGECYLNDLLLCNILLSLKLNSNENKNFKVLFDSYSSKLKDYFSKEIMSSLNFLDNSLYKEGYLALSNNTSFIYTYLNAEGNALYLNTHCNSGFCASAINYIEMFEKSVYDNLKKYFFKTNISKLSSEYIVKTEVNPEYVSLSTFISRVNYSPEIHIEKIIKALFEFAKTLSDNTNKLYFKLWEIDCDNIYINPTNMINIDIKLVFDASDFKSHFYFRENGFRFDNNNNVLVIKNILFIMLDLLQIKHRYSYIKRYSLNTNVYNYGYLFGMLIWQYKLLRMFANDTSREYTIEDYYKKFLYHTSIRECRDNVSKEYLKLDNIFNSHIKDTVLVDKLWSIRRFVKDSWVNGPKDCYFFTLHNEQHSDFIVNSLSKLIDEAQNFTNLNKKELFRLYASSYLHDIGMLNEPEKDKLVGRLQKENNFKSYAADIDSLFKAFAELRTTFEEVCSVVQSYDDVNIDVLNTPINGINAAISKITYDNFETRGFEEYKRKFYRNIIEQFNQIDNIRTDIVRIEHSKNTNKFLNRKHFSSLNELDAVELRDIGNISECHYISVEDMEKKVQEIEFDKSSQIKLRYLCQLLRVGDCLDLCCDRVVKDFLKNNYFRMESESRWHWIKHMCIQEVTIKRVDEECKDDTSFPYIDTKNILIIIVFKKFPKYSLKDNKLIRSKICNKSDLAKCSLKEYKDKYSQIIDKYKEHVENYGKVIDFENIECDVKCSFISKSLGYLFEEIKTLNKYQKDNEIGFWKIDESQHRALLNFDIIVLESNEPENIIISGDLTADNFFEEYYDTQLTT
ncbi:MAG: RNA-directed DNA polymerase [Clostridia bacterium]|nr:RNA-directed DNA polymerase [Clostridia bacterium]